MTIKTPKKINDYLYNEMFYQYFDKIIPIKDNRDKLISIIHSL